MKPHRHSGIQEGFKHCSKCDKILPETEFYRDKSSYDNLQKLCKKCGKERDKKRDRNEYFKKQWETKEYRARCRLRNNPHLYPLTEFCEVCPKDDLNKATQHHHPDYDYPAIYVSVCSQCHAYL